ncbi:MAG: alpha/beta hydrolase [Cytophagales bacterium]|nr:MAG: alpha/beta hydrolase [Cytophagales bacterium]
MEYHIKEESNFKYLDVGTGETIMLLHGLFGALSNWEAVVNDLKKDFRVIIPIMPIFDINMKSASVEGLANFIESFVNFKKLDQLTLLGNSLGGHVGLIYTLKNPNKVKRLALTGSSGLFENSMGGSFPKRGSYEYIKERVAYTFYDPATATKELIDEVFNIVKDIGKCIRIIAIARSAQRHNMAKDIVQIKAPTLLIWGLNDTITPPAVAHEFNTLITNSTLYFIDKCCHAPMMEHPEKFNKLFRRFLQSNT